MELSVIGKCSRSRGRCGLYIALVYIEGQFYVQMIFIVQFWNVIAVLLIENIWNSDQTIVVWFPLRNNYLKKISFKLFSVFIGFGIYFGFVSIGLIFAKEFLAS